MSLKIEFVERASEPGTKIAPLCREFGISRETGHKWLKRYRASGFDGLEERSRRPRNVPLATAEELVMAVLQLREAYPRWGPKKIVLALKKKHGDGAPSRVTIARILQRFGKVRERRVRRPVSVVDRAPQVEAKAPNDAWTIDFKGWWRTADGSRCEPLTVRDAFSRFVLASKVMTSTSLEGVRRELERLFRKHGVPRVIQCDNGSPFICTQARGGLTRLSAWWVCLGIRIARSRPGCPQDNGGHERMHRDMRADVQAFPDETPGAAQRSLDRWRQEFNHVRPHEAIGGKVPADLYRRVPRRPLVRHRHTYPHGWATRMVYSIGGRISVSGQAYSLGRALVGYTVGLEPLGVLSYRVWFGEIDLGLIELAPATIDLDRGCERFIEKPLRRTKKRAA